MNSINIVLALTLPLFCTACAATPDGISSNALVGEWDVELINGSPVTAPGTAFLGFGNDGRVYGNTSVNRLLGSWSLDVDTLKLEQLDSTRMAGSPTLMEQESLLLGALERAVHAKRDKNGSLVLLSANGTPVIAAFPRSQ